MLLFFLRSNAVFLKGEIWEVNCPVSQNCHILSTIVFLLSSLCFWKTIETFTVEKHSDMNLNFKKFDY